MFKLSLLVATLPNRELNYLPNIPNWCELIIDDSIGNLGEKRQRMLEDANGEYVAFLDDDDEPTKDYLSEFKKGIDKSVDIVCIGMDRFIDGEFWNTIRFGFSNPHSGIVTSAGHFCAVRRELALRSGYRSCGRGEDYDHIIGLQDHIKTAHYIEKVTLKQMYVTRDKEYDLYLSNSNLPPRVVSGSKSMV